jgi:hypothetical protein
MALKNKVSGLMPARVTQISWLALVQTVGPPVLVCAVLVWAALHFVKSAPPHTLTLSSGPKGSSFETIAQRYSKILARNGIQLKVLPSEGSLDNLNRIADPKSHIDIALVQSGLTTNADTEDLESLGGPSRCRGCRS